MKQHMASEVAPNSPIDVLLVDLATDVTLPQAGRFTRPDVTHERCLLVIVDAKASEKSRHSGKAEALVLNAEQKLPVKRVLKCFVEAAELVPDPRTPKQCFLGNEIGPF